MIVRRLSIDSLQARDWFTSIPVRYLCIARTVRFTLSRDSFARNRSLSSSSRTPTMPQSGCFLSFLIGFVIKFHRSYSAASVACSSRVRCSLISFVVAKTRRLKL